MRSAGNNKLMNSSVSARLNADLLDEKYALWCEDPRSVEATWSSFFEGFELGVSQAKTKAEAAGTAVWLRRMAVGPRRVGVVTRR